MTTPIDASASQVRGAARPADAEQAAHAQAHAPGLGDLLRKVIGLNASTPEGQSVLGHIVSDDRARAFATEGLKLLSEKDAVGAAVVLAAAVADQKGLLRKIEAHTPNWVKHVADKLHVSALTPAGLARFTGKVMSAAGAVQSTVVGNGELGRNAGLMAGALALGHAFLSSDMADKVAAAAVQVGALPEELAVKVRAERMDARAAAASTSGTAAPTEETAQKASAEEQGVFGARQSEASGSVGFDVSDPSERKQLAADAAALVQGQSQVLEKQLSELSAKLMTGNVEGPTDLLAIQSLVSTRANLSALSGVVEKAMGALQSVKVDDAKVLAGLISRVQAQEPLTFSDLLQVAGVLQLGKANKQVRTLGRELEAAVGGRIDQLGKAFEQVWASAGESGELGGAQLQQLQALLDEQRGQFRFALQALDFLHGSGGLGAEETALFGQMVQALATPQGPSPALQLQFDAMRKLHGKSEQAQGLGRELHDAMAKGLDALEARYADLAPKAMGESPDPAAVQEGQRLAALHGEVADLYRVGVDRLAEAGTLGVTEVKTVRTAMAKLAQPESLDPAKLLELRSQLTLAGADKTVKALGKELLAAVKPVLSPAEGAEIDPYLAAARQAFAGGVLAFLSRSNGVTEAEATHLRGVFAQLQAGQELQPSQQLELVLALRLHGAKEDLRGRAQKLSDAVLPKLQEKEAALAKLGQEPEQLQAAQQLRAEIAGLRDSAQEIVEVLVQAKHGGLDGVTANDVANFTRKLGAGESLTAADRLKLDARAQLSGSSKETQKAGAQLLAGASSQVAQLQARMDGVREMAQSGTLPEEQQQQTALLLQDLQNQSRRWQAFARASFQTLADAPERA